MTEFQLLISFSLLYSTEIIKLLLDFGSVSDVLKILDLITEGKKKNPLEFIGSKHKTDFNWLSIEH